MADAYTGTSAISNLVLSAIDQYVRADLRHQPILRAVADTRPVAVDRPGSSVALYIHGDLAPATTPLSETTDPDFIALPNPTSVTLTPVEYGNAVVTTLKAQNVAFADIEPYKMNQIAWNMRDTLDVLVQAVLAGSTNVLYAKTGGTGSRRTADNQILNADVITSADIRYIVGKLRGAAAQGRRGDLFWCGIHPDVSVDLRSETGAGAWRDSHQYAAPGVFWPGEIGIYEGCFFVESARMPLTYTGGTSADPGTGADAVYQTIFAGREALAEGVVVEPEVRVGHIPDKLNRFFPMGWYGFLGWTIFRQKALWSFHSGASNAVES